MKPSLLLKSPSLWPTDRAGVLDVAARWYEPALVALNEQVVDAFPLGEVTPPPVGETNLELAGKMNTLAVASQFAIAMNAINYMFWDKTDSGEFVRYQKDGQVGALAMTEAFRQAWENPESHIQRALQQGIALTAQDIQEVFGDIPRPQSRADILNEVLLSPRLAELGETMAQVGQDNTAFDTALAAQLAQAFPLAYGDEVLKKAQLAVSAVWREARMRGSEATCVLTAFADYQIPNVLRALNVLQYDENLAKRIDQGDLIEENSPEERAIRAAAILAVERLSHSQGVFVADVDYWVWLKRREPKTPFHLTDTTAY